MWGVLLCKYYSLVHTATTEQRNIVSPRILHIFWPQLKNLLHLFCFMRKNRFALEYCHFSPPHEWKIPIGAWCVMRTTSKRWLVCSSWRQETFTRGSSHTGSDSSHPSYLPPRQLQLGNRSLFKSFMRAPQKRKACRKLRDRNEECVIVPLICDDLWHNGCNWFDNRSLFPLRREES